MFIVFEGIDGSGKTTLIESVKKYLESRGRKVKTTREPTSGTIGSFVRDTDGLTPESEALLFTADRACHTEEIEKWLSDGYDVIADRYYASTIAYQAASGTDRKWLESINSKVIVEPTMTFLLDISPEVSLRRVDTRGEEKSRFEKAEYLRRVREEYLSTAKEKGFTVIDASRAPEEVSREVLKEIERAM